MENLFRLILSRPAVAQDPQNPSAELAQATPYQTALRDAAASGRGHAAIEEAGTAYVAGPDFIGDPAADPLAAPLATLATRLDLLEGRERLTHRNLSDAVRAAFGQDPHRVVGGKDFGPVRARLRDSVLAVKTLQEQHHRPIEELVRQLRTMEVIARADADPQFPSSGAQLRAWRRRSLKLPFDLGLTSRLSTREAEAQLRQQRQQAAEDRQQQVEGLLAEHERLRTALAELGTLDARHFRVSPQADSTVSLPPDALRLTVAAAGESVFAQSVRSANLGQLGVPPVINVAHPPGRPAGQPAAGNEAAGPAPAAGAAPAADGAPGPDGSVVLAQALLAAPARVLAGREAFQAVDLAEVGFVLNPSASKSLSEATKAVLADRTIDLATTPLDRVTQRLEFDLAGTVGQLEVLAGHPVKQSFRRIGDALVSVTTPVTAGWGTLGTGGVVPLPPFPLDGRIPHTKGDVTPAGIADLLIVRQQLTGYEGADIAHIENVLKGERKGREHTRRDETVVTTVSETEVTTTEEHELQSTDRFEMTRETSQTIKEDVALKAGLNISGSYGPTVDFSASAEGSFSRSKEEATKAATTFSKDVTERSSRKIAERVLNRTTVQVTTEVIEKNTHELNNTGGGGNIAGVYQWVNKVYQAQMFNYGLRAMFDFMVPEPAAFLIGAMTQAHQSALSLTKPPDFPLTPAQITESNYAYWVAVLQASDVAPPPELYKTKSADYKAGGGDHDTDYNQSGQITLDDGYRAIYGSVAVVRNIWEADNSVDVALGRRTQRMGGSNWQWTTTLDDERDSVPYAIDTFRCSQVAVAIEVKCQRTDRAMDKWRLETHAKLTTAHKALVADYEEKLANLQLQAGVTIRGANPATNLAVMQAELKKNCISILTDQHFDLFDAIETSAGNGLPEIDVFEAAGEGAYVRFFEEAFEWEQMTWVTYPYFWGRKDQWDERIGYDDPDPMFNQFLQAGYCRASVPARPGFEGAIDHFLTFGEIWNGGPLPTVSSPLYLPIADEIAERLDRPGQEVPQGDPWTVRIPTDLVHLRPDDRLPRWEQNAQGEWVEA